MEIKKFHYKKKKFQDYFPCHRNICYHLDVPLKAYFVNLQSVSWSLAEFRHNRIVQLPRENCFNVCRQLQRKVRSRKHDV